MATILIVGAADTGRAPMAAALLRRLLTQHGYGWAVASAGVLGHDDAAAETEARDTMVHLGLDISEHRARSVDEAILADSSLVIAIDSGTARVLEARFPGTRASSLGELAGRSRDIPDPFRMQIGAWMTYAREIDTMLETALPRIVKMMPADSQTSSAPLTTAANESPALDAERQAAAARITQLLQVAAQMPGVVDWAAACARIDADLAGITATPAAANDLAPAYLGLLRAALKLVALPPTAGQLAVLSQAAARLHTPIAQDDVNEFLQRLAMLPTLQ